MRLFLLMAILSQVPVLFAQNDFKNIQIQAGSNWSIKGGDESYQASINFPLPFRLHAGLTYGTRPQSPNTQVIQLNTEYDLFYFTHQRVKFNSCFAIYRRYSSVRFDAAFFKQTLGVGYQIFAMPHVGVAADYNFIGLSYGTRHDPFGNPNMLEAGEAKVGLFFSF